MNKIKPTKKQLEFLDWELGVFFHFGIRTFNEGHTDWDGADMALETFNPDNLDCESWIKTIKDAGAKYAVFTAKHHDGFANWPSEYTEYSVKNTPWKNGKGDIVREFTDACRKYDIKPGIYYSPAQFGSREMNSKEYDDFFINQISELLTNYGKIYYLWFDGCGSENHEYDTCRIIKAIRKMQPDILIFNMWDPDTRWVGNEEGITPDGTRYTTADYAISVNSTSGNNYDMQRFLPYECDCRIRRFNWFYSENDEQHLRSTDDLMGLYDYSVGRGGNLLLNIAPDRHGLLPEKDAKVFTDFGGKLKERFANPIKTTVKQNNNVFEIHPHSPSNVTTIVLEENLSEGESINSFTITLSNIYSYATIDVPIYKGCEIGHKRIITIPTAYIDEKHILKLTINDSNGEFDIKKISLFNLQR